MTRRIALMIALLAGVIGCGPGPESDEGVTLGGGSSPSTPAETTPTLAEARQGFATQVDPSVPRPAAEPLPQPPPGVFRLVKYHSPVGDLAAYVTPDPGDGQKHPAVVWITGGDSSSLGEMWEPRPRENDQTGAAFRQHGLVLMTPTLRGGNDNPGRREGFYGEVDDILAAADYLAAQPYVDPDRIYLGGHSTGGTLVMLVAEISDRFRATFAFGPASDMGGYGGEFVYYRPGDPREARLRSPALWLSSVRRPLFVIEAMQEGRLEDLQAMQRLSHNSQIHFVPVPGVDHFSILGPANEAIAAKILADTGPTANISLSPAELNGQAR